MDESSRKICKDDMKISFELDIKLDLTYFFMSFLVLFFLFKRFENTPKPRVQPVVWHISKPDENVGLRV